VGYILPELRAALLGGGGVMGDVSGGPFRPSTLQGTEFADDSSNHYFMM